MKEMTIDIATIRFNLFFHACRQKLEKSNGKKKCSNSYLSPILVDVPSETDDVAHLQTHLVVISSSEGIDGTKTLTNRVHALFDLQFVNNDEHFMSQIILGGTIRKRFSHQHSSPGIFRPFHFSLPPSNFHRYHDEDERCRPC